MERRTIAPGDSRRSSRGSHANVIGRCAATSADNIQPAVLCPLAQFGRETFRRFRETSLRKRIGQTGIRIGAGVSRRAASEFFHIWFHFVRPERAIKAEHKRIRVRDGNQKRFHGLTAQDSTGKIGHRSGNNERNFFAGAFENLRDGGDRSFRVERVENCFDGEQIDAAFKQCRSLARA